jgi:hypothetical protein
LSNQVQDQVHGDLQAPYLSVFLEDFLFAGHGSALLSVAAILSVT